ncbi:MAG: ABC transporter permease [Alphaproteobacteria bacterium]
MLAFVIRRLLQSIVVLLAVAAVAFVIFNYVGDPINAMVGQDTSQQDREALRERLGLNNPLPVRYVEFVWRAIHGDFGISYRLAEPVLPAILRRFPATMELSLVAALLAVVVGIPLGVYTGLYPRRWLSRFFQVTSLIGVSLPTFLIGILLILIFSVLCTFTAPKIGIDPRYCLPSSGRGDLTDLGWWKTGFLTVGGLKALILPSITLGLFQMTLIMRLVRAEMLEVLRTDYIKFARARGLSDRTVHFGHALKNSLVPVITITGLQLGAIIAFAIITETVFAWPGMGQLFVQSVYSTDIPVMAAYLVFVGFIIVIINLITDLLYFAVDPRLRDSAFRGAR